MSGVVVRSGYAQAGSLQLGTAVSRGSVAALICGRTQGYATAETVARGFGVAVDLACELAEAIDGIVARRLDRRLVFSRDEDLDMARELGDGVGYCLVRARALASGFESTPAREEVLSSGRALDQARERARALDSICTQGLAGRLGVATAEGMALALTDGALDDFTSADLTCANLADADLTGVLWSLTGTTWPPGTNIKALVARSRAQGSILVFKRQGMMWQPSW
jgi:hypothetical protein